MLTNAVRSARLEVERALSARYPIIHIVTDDYGTLIQIMEGAFFDRSHWDFSKGTYTLGEPSGEYIRLEPDMPEENLRRLVNGAGVSRKFLDDIQSISQKVRDLQCICENELPVNSAPEQSMKEIAQALQKLQVDAESALKKHGANRAVFYGRGDGHKDDGSFSERTVLLLEKYIEMKNRAMSCYPPKGKEQPEEWPDSCVVLYGCNTVIPQSVERYVYRIELEALSNEDFAEILSDFGVRDETVIKWYADWLAGFTESEIRAILREIDVNAGDSPGASSHFNSGPKKIIEKKKHERIKKHGKLEYIQVPEVMKMPSNMKNIDGWLQKHKASIRDSSKKNSDEITKGMLLVGIPGTGKSLAAHGVASSLNLPLYQLKMSSILSKFVGDSDKNLQEVLEDVKNAAPLVLWIDEIEKALAGADGGDNTGVMQRLFGQLLTFMQDMNRTVFIIATANDVSRFPPEFKRNGRFDIRCCMPMPSYDECVSIMMKKVDDFLGCSKNEKLARKLFDICCDSGQNEKTRFLTGADINAAVKELKIELGNIWYGRAVTEEEEKTICEAMRRAVASIGMTGETKNPETIRSIAKCYRGMLEMSAMMTGDGEPLLSPERYHPERILLGDHQASNHCPSCMDKPINFKQLPSYDRQLFDVIVPQLDLLLAQELKNDDYEQYKQYMVKYRKLHKIE